MSFTGFLKRFPAINLALSGAAAALSKTLLQKSLVPDNLDWLGGAGVLVAILAFLCVWARLISSRAKGWLILIAAASLVSVLGMRIQLVEHFDYYGEGFNELRGWRLSPYGETLKANLEEDEKHPLSMHDVIYYSDHRLMVPLFGANWYLSAALYSGSFLLFLFSVVAVAGRFELDAKDSPEAG
jgi:hypothetical protein